MELYNFISLAGLFGFVFIGWLLSTSRKDINWHVVVWGISFQFLFAWFLFVFPVGIKFFMLINTIVNKILASSTAGAEFMFGALALPPGMKGAGGEESIGFIFAFQALPTIIFFSALMSILYFLNIIPRIVKFFSYLFTKLMRVSGAESLCAASNIFVGIESALTIKPFLKNMTKSELCTVLTAGMATVASNVLALYVFSLQDVFPNIAGHLVSASFLSAPAALAMSKVLLPETEQPETLNENVELHIERENNIFEAVINGANTGVKLIVGISALLIAVLGLVHLIDQIFLGLGGLINQMFDWNGTLSLKSILGVIFYPFTVMMGVPLEDAGILSRIIGERVIVTEVTSYHHLAGFISKGILESPRSIVITTYALCGFAHLASMAIFIGGVAAIVPERMPTLARIGFRALLAATLACLMTGAVAGTFFTESSMLLGT
ncbi:MAG: nucleoside transporter [Candidatus Omnitrophica bacterium]|nr:nucleoside transporter [Candidatus Omnitrophota bacterium]